MIDFKKLQPVVTRTQPITGNVAKIDPTLARIFATNPTERVSGIMQAKASADELSRWVNVPGFRINAIAGDIMTFHGATKAIVERLAEHPAVRSIEGARMMHTNNASFG
jgi:hypothetical protein